jgi:pantoate kinase
MTIRSWAPGHATLFFAVPQTYEDYQEMGSIGGGLNLESGVTTSISLSNEKSVFWNDAKINGLVSNTVTRFVEELIDEKINVRITHESNLKTGYGFSTSGAGAIGTALGLNQLFDIGLGDMELFELAHKAEVLNHTGLGSVVGQITGGIEIRLTQGGPNLCKTISVPSDSKLIIGFIGPLSTKDVLTSPDQMRLVTKTGIESVEKVRLINNLTLKDMIQVGREFSDSCGLMTNKIRKTIDKLESIEETNVTMAMIGEALIIDPVDQNKVIELFELNNIKYLVTNVTTRLPTLVSS